MGNHLSCISPASLERLQQQVVSSNPDLSKSLIKILHYVDGSFAAELEEPLTAAEVMMESPGLFLCCHSQVLSSAGRISAIPADEELRGSELYILMPMYKLNARFSAEEIAYFDCEKSKKNYKGGGPCHNSLWWSFDKMEHAGPSALCTQGRQLLMRSLSAKLDPASATNCGTAPTMKGITMCRSKSWMPNLETITEARVAF